MFWARTSAAHGGTEPNPIERYAHLIKGPARLTGLDLEGRLGRGLVQDAGQPPPTELRCASNDMKNLREREKVEDDLVKLFRTFNVGHVADARQNNLRRTRNIPRQ